MSKLVTIVIHNEIECEVLGLDKAHSQHFSDSYAVLTANYFFNPKYKLGVWDGKIRYFSPAGKTYVYLLDEIVPSIRQLGYAIKLDDRRQDGIYLTPNPITADIFAHKTDKFGNPTMLRDYQLRLVNGLLGYGDGIAIAATGAGKTICTAALSYAYEKVGGTSFVIVPSTTLVVQTRRDLQGFGLDVGEYSGTIKDLDHPHVVSTWQALQNNPGVISDRHVVIVDECLEADTNIRMGDGTLKHIQEIVPGDMVMCYNEQTQRKEKKKVVKRHENLVKTNNERMYELKFDNGVILRVTGNHEVYTTTGRVRVDELTEEHDVLDYSND